MSWRPRDFNMRQILPSDYQVELVGRAICQNTIIPLSKNDSKIFVSIQLIKEYSYRLMRNHEKAVLLVNSVSLLEERATQIEFHSSLKVLRIGAGFSDNKSELIKESQVLVISPQIFLGLLNKKAVDLKMVALLILDDCHHCLIGSHPYCQIMKKYRTLSAKRPRILGLTPSLLNKRVSPSNIKGTAKRLERIMHSRLETASDLAIICKYVNKPKKFISLEKLRVFIEINTDFREEVTQVDPRKPILEAINRASATLRQVGSWCAMRGCLLWKKKLAKLAEEPFLGPKQRSALKTAEATFHLCSKMLGQKVGCVNSFAKLVGDSPQASFVSDRVRKLLEILIDYAPSKRTALSAKAPLSALVFVNERFIAFMINTLLKALVKWETEMFGHLKVDFLVDNNYPPCESGEEERKLANKKLEQTLQRFRNGQLNVLVTTNVLEEGVDIRNCNLVIRFDVPVDFRSFVLSSGRARRENGAFYIISEERNYASLVNELENYSKIEEFIMDHYSSNEILKEEEIPKNVDELFPPYAVESPSGRAQVTLSGAIPLINRYCSKLPSDVFTRLVPHYEFNSAQQRDGKHSHFAQLLLPINSPLKECIQLNECGGIAEIEALFASKSLALMSVALEACKKLHQTKELSDQLTPTGKEIVTNLLGELEDDEEYLPYLLNKSGPTKRRRLYDRKTSKSLVGTLPALDSICIVYVIEMRLVKPISEENNPKKRRIIDPHEIDWAFGFLSCKELPSIPAFPVYQRQGEMLVKIRKANAPLLLTQELFQLVSLFHQHIFEDILRIARGGLAYSPEYSPIPLPIVPLKRVGPTDDDYELDRSHLRCDIRDHPTMPPEECRRNFSFDESRYADAVVMPWYRSEEQSAFYYVAEICGDQNPASPFPDPKFSSFNEYFTAKYQLKIFNQEQCLLDVDHTSARMNLLLPRSGSGKVSKKPLDPSQRQILVPELVNIHPFSAALWSMIIALPTILYRTNSLLLADEFRVKIMEDALKMSECAKTPSAEWKWGPLCYNVPQANGCVGEAEQQKPHQQIIIKNLDQLKKINQEEEGLKKNGSGTATKERTGKHGESNLEEFEIGIWDPEDLVTPSVERIHSPQVVNSLSAENGHLSNGLRNGHRELSSTREEEISELIAIGSDYSIHSYGDLSDEDEVAAEYANCTFLMHNKVSDIDLGDIEHAGLRERGWGENDAEDFVTNNIQIENDFLPLTISRNNPDINIVTLMDDLQKNFSGDLGGVLSNCGESQQAKQNPRVHNKTEPSSHKQPKPVLLINELCLDPMHAMDELDKRLEEDVVGEEFFYWDDQDAVMKLEEFDRIDENTKRPDSPECVDFPSGNQHFEVTAPDISDWMQFSFMYNKLAEHPHGVSPVLLLQALTTSSASDGINLERLETIGDSFLKMAVTDYLYHTHPEQHEGKLSFARSKEVSNSRLFYLGRQRNIPVLMETAKFDPHVNWLPPCYASTSEFHAVNPLDQNDHEEEVGEIPQQSVIDEKKVELTGWGTLDDDRQHYKCENGVETITFPQEIKQKIELDLPPLPYNMLTQQWISDKSIADAVEALIGAHLIQLGQEAVLKFMNWLGVRVLTKRFCVQPQPLDTHSRKSLLLLYNKFDFSKVEDTIGYKFADKGFLIQAFTHASYFNNRVTGCYQRLEFLGDAILDYMITRFLFEHRKQYSPGVLTDLRSALVNNTIFASLAVKYNFHKHFIMLCPPLFQMIEKFVNFCKQKDFLHCANFDDEIFMITEDEIDEGHEEDVEVPKAMGDIFESLAGAVYLDCGMDLDIVWRVFYGLMRDVIEKCCVNPPQSPVRELFERKNCKAKFAKLERKLETGKVRVTVTVNENLHFTGMGRGYRIAKCTAAKRALQHLRKLDAAKSKKDAEKKAIGAI
uniref:Helicase ATP-binding domain-containing protein n=1 Tax=Globodera rostochiensis TaxID=31243 RepID=A0A914HEZ6_GLORO